jgi:hypothetical protein
VLNVKHIQMLLDSNGIGNIIRQRMVDGDEQNQESNKK